MNIYIQVCPNQYEPETLPIGIREFIAHYDIRWGEIMATSVLISIPVIIIFISIQRYFIAGLTAGAVKE